MISPRRCLLLALVSLWLCPLAATAGEYKYPTTLPAMTLNLPDGWKVATVPGPARLIVCTVPKDPNFVVSLMTLPTSTTLANLEDPLDKAARGAAESAKLTDVTVSTPAEEKIGDGERKFVVIRASGKLKGAPASILYAAFSLTEDGQFYLLGEAGPTASVAARKEEFQRVANSIHPYELPAPSPTPVLRLALPPPSQGQ